MDSWGAEVVDGRLRLDAPEAFREWVATLDGQRVTVTVSKAQRSAAQNRYYQGVVVPVLAEHIGYEQPEMHEVLKGEFLPYGTRSTTDLTAAEFTDYVERICRWAAEKLDCVIPPPRG
jgi:hypothetical protein